MNKSLPSKPRLGQQQERLLQRLDILLGGATAVRLVAGLQRLSIRQANRSLSRLDKLGFVERLRNGMYSDYTDLWRITRAGRDFAHKLRGRQRTQ